MSLKRRQLRGLEIVAQGDQIRLINASKYLVSSQSDSSKWYEVLWHKDQWSCSCPDYSKHHKRCKHIYAVNYFAKLRQIILGVRNPHLDGCCPKCGSKQHVTKRGIRYNRSAPVQRYYCKKCRESFSGRTGFKGMKKGATAIILALDLYYRGLSLRKISDHLAAIYGIKVTHGTVYSWIKKYVTLIKKYVSKFQGQVSERWHADETVVKVSGGNLTLWTLLDSETRFLIASHISEGRGMKGACLLLREGLKKARRRPLEVITDGLPSYNTAIEKEFQSMEGLLPLHIQGPFTSPLNNNRMERFYETLKNRTKITYGLNSVESASLFTDGFSLYYNFIRPHQSLHGETPAKMAGILPHISQNKWLQLIWAASTERMRDGNRETNCTES